MPDIDANVVKETEVDREVGRSGRDSSGFPHESRTIRNRLPKTKLTTANKKSAARVLPNLMLQGKTKEALCLIREKNVATCCNWLVIPLVQMVYTSYTVRGALLLSKYPTGQLISTNTLHVKTTTEPPTVHAVVFEAIDTTTIETAVLRTDMAQQPVCLALIPRVGDSCMPHIHKADANRSSYHLKNNIAHTLITIIVIQSMHIII